MIHALYSFGILLLAYFLIFSGLAFSNKDLLPELLQPVYDQTNYLIRVVIFTVFLAFPANWLVPKAFQISSASVAGPLLLATVTYAMLIDKVRLTMPLTLTAAGALFFCCLTAWLLEKQRAG